MQLVTLNGKQMLKAGCGATVRDINTFLDRQDLSLWIMGGYDGQTIVGAVSTSTHGSGINYKPFPDYVQELTLLTVDSDGTADPQVKVRVTIQAVGVLVLYPHAVRQSASG